ncbi:MAG: PrgI family protein [Candidatus Moraniibacteriota bacterium]
MLINVPQYLDVEDKVAGPLTMKQLGWMIALGVILLVLWNMMPSVVFFIIGLPVAALFTGLAFFRPYGQPLGSFVIFGILYYFRPKIYVWKRAPQREQIEHKDPVVETAHLADKKMSSQSLKSLAQLLDSQGAQYNKNLEEILKKPVAKK